MRKCFSLFMFLCCLFLLSACQAPKSAGLATVVDLADDSSQVRFDDNRLAASASAGALTRHNPTASLSPKSSCRI